MTLVGDPWHTKGRQYAYGGGGSPIGAKVNYYRRIEPFLTAGCKYHHISNANLSDVNHGMDSLLTFVGGSFFRR